jgi:hypothetical protein
LLAFGLSLREPTASYGKAGRRGAWAGAGS